MAAAKEVGAELVIAQRSLLGDRRAGSTGITLSMAGPSAYEQIKELVCNRATPEEERGTTPTILIADASASQIQAVLSAAGTGDGQCRIPSLTGQGVPTPGGPDPTELIAIANAQWGYRATGMITHLVPIGDP
eukprot:74551-Pyramimonas_sp.AAC.1